MQGIMAQYKGGFYKNSEVKGKISDGLDSAVFDAGKLSQAITKSSRTREVCCFISNSEVFNTLLLH